MAAKRTGRRKPTSLVVLEGNPGHRPVKAPVELPAGDGVPEPPARLPEGARRYWRMLAPLLVQVGLLTEADGPALADLCLCLHRIDQAEALLEKDGLVVTTAKGPRKHPAAALAKEYRAHAQTWAKRFGLDPYSRGALDVAPKDVKDEIAELLEGGR